LTNNRQDATTDLFYSVNLWHDHLLAAPIGFNEASRNFEFVNSSGAPGAGDPVHAEANDFSGLNNANMTTLPDGTPPQMQMYLWNGTSWNPPNDMNGTYSWDVVFHEYTHGLSNRLIGNGFGLNALQSGAMGEGWSDWYAMDYLVAQGLQADTPAPGEAWLGQYATGVPGLFGGNSRIRHQAIDCTIGASAAACPANGGSAGTGGFTCGDMGLVGPNNGVHDNGEIWSQTLWDLRTALGSNAAEAIITGGMRLSPTSPTMLQERNAILQAAQTLGVNVSTVWQVFANRGFGLAATTPGANSFSCSEDFTAPRSISINDITVTEGNSGTVTATLTVSATPATGAALSFDYATADGTATQPSDYAQASGSGNIGGAGSTTTIDVPVNGDIAVEGNEAFTVTLSNVSGGSINDGTGRVTIADDDSADTSPPNTKIDSGPRPKTKKKKATFTFSADESPVAFECKLDRGAFATCTSPARFKVKKGKHTLQVRAVDASINIDQSPASYSWKVKKKRHKHHH
jgi:hypothetical protein